MDFAKTDDVLEILLSTEKDYQYLTEVCADLYKNIKIPHENASGRKYPSVLTQCILECFKIKNNFSSSVWYSKKECVQQKMTPVTAPVSFSRVGSDGEIFGYELYNSDQVKEYGETITTVKSDTKNYTFLQKAIINCVNDFQGLYGRGGIAKLLKGSKAIKENGFNDKALTSVYYGLAEDMTLTSLSSEIDTLIDDKILVIKKGTFGRPLLTIPQDIEIPNLDISEKSTGINSSVMICDEEDDENFKNIMNIIQNGENLFITGHAGTGKSYILNKLKQRIPSLVVTSTTGIAAVNVKGQTLHSWAGVGICNRSVEQTVERILKKSSLKKNIQKAAILAIDEISMLDINTFEYVDMVLRKVRDNWAPFGGLQLILIGDFFQLPPVNKDNSKELKYCFESDLWQDLKLKTVLLTENYRQKEKDFIEILSHMRINALTKDDINFLKQREFRYDNDLSDILHIFATNSEADNYNNTRLRSIDSKEYHLFSFDGIYKGKKLITTPKTEKDSNILKRIDTVCNAEKNIVIKNYARVMLLINLDFEKGLINGSCGTVLEIDEDYILILFDNGVTSKIERHDFEFYNNEELIAVRKQFPIRLAYGITIHKSQGMSLDKLVVDCSRIFEKGQAYVAFSRIKTFEGLYLHNFNPSRVMVDSKVANFYNHLKSDL